MAILKFAAVALVGSSLVWTACVAQTALTDKEKQEVVHQAADHLARSYVFPDRGLKAGQAITEALVAGKYAAISDPVAFSDRLTQDLQAVTHDLHMRVRSMVRPVSPVPQAEKEVPQQSDGGFVRVERLKGNIGYIRVDGFVPLDMLRDAADEAMKLVADTHALIIDLRRNGGGDPASVAYLCSFFFDPRHPIHLNDLIWRREGTAEFDRQEYWTVPVPSHYLGKPVMLLSSGDTFSGAEEFLNDLKVQRRATVIGAKSGGGANPGGMVPLADGFSIFIPTGRAENPVTKGNWEGTGVSPDIAVEPEKALAVAYAKISGSNKPFVVEATLMQATRTRARPESEAILRRLLADISSGQPDYADLRPSGAEAVFEVAGQARRDMRKFGALRDVTFKRVNEMGGDVFYVTFEKGTADWALVLDREGRVVLLDYQPNLANSAAD